MDDIDNRTQPLGSEPTNTPESGEPTKRISPWIWVAIGVAVLVVGALLYSASSDDTGGLALLLRGGTVAVPQVVGQPQAQALSAIEAAGLRVGQVSQVDTLAVPPGVVVKQSPVPDTMVKADSAVDIAVSTLAQVKVPDVTGSTESAASQTLAEQGLRIGTVSYVFDSDVDAGDVTAQDPDSGAEVAVGSAVNLTISKGEKQGQVPNVVGLAQTDAEATIEAAGFASKSTKAENADVPAGDVISQSPAAGTVTDAGSTVTIKVSTGVPTPAEPEPPASDSGTPPEEPTTPESPPAEKPKPEPSQVSVPDLIGMRVVEALGALRQAKLKFKIAWGSTETGFLLVIEQDPAAGAEVDPGAAVTITIGLPSFSFEKPTQLPAPEPAPTPAPQPAPQPSPEPPTGESSGGETTSAP